MKVRNLLTLAAALSLVLLVYSACGDDTNAPLGVTNVSPVGSVGGLVVDASTMKGIANVQVRVIAGGKQYPEAGAAKTDASGYFSITKVPTGDLIITMTPAGDGYLPVTITETLANAAGEFPLDNSTLSVGPVGMLPKATANAAFAVQLVRSDGAPAPSITAFLRAGLGWIDFSNAGNPVARGTTVVEAKSTNVGLARFVGMPDFNKLAGLVGSGGISDTVRVRIPPYGGANSTAYDFVGKEVVYNVTTLTEAIPTIVLRNTPPGALKIEAASIAAFTGKEGNRELSTTSGPLFLAFNWPIESKRLQLSIYNEAGKLLSPAPKATVTGNLLTVNFTGGLTLQRGSEYNLNIYAVATDGGVMLNGNFGAPIFTPATAGSQVSITSMTRGSSDPSNPNYKKLIVTFSEPIGTGVPDKSLTGNNAVIFVNYDVDGSGSIGDGTNEVGYSQSNIPLLIDEKDPPGPAGKSGLATRWSFTYPTDKLGNQLNAGTVVRFMFSKSADPVERATGELVGDAVQYNLPQ